LKARYRRGFGLVELIVALAIFIIISVMIFTGLSSYFKYKTFYDQEMLLQQNFRFAIDKVTQDMRSAVQDVTTKKIVESPGLNEMSDKLTFDTASGQVTYQLVGDEQSGYEIERNGQPVTEKMHQLVKLYFVFDGRKVVTIIVGKTKYGNRDNVMSFTSIVYPRNVAYPD
jgi:type II secretory pathway component PulJ